jgi:hypothetical protein
MASQVAQLKELLDEKFAAHEHRSQLAISELEGRLRDAAYEEAKAHAARHAETLAVLAGHQSEITAHDVRIKRVEDQGAKLEAKREAGVDHWRLWAMGVMGTLLASALASIVSALKH